MTPQERQRWQTALDAARDPAERTYLEDHLRRLDAEGRLEAPAPPPAPPPDGADEEDAGSGHAAADRLLDLFKARYGREPTDDEVEAIAQAGRGVLSRDREGVEEAPAAHEEPTGPTKRQLAARRKVEANQLKQLIAVFERGRGRAPDANELLTLQEAARSFAAERTGRQELLGVAEGWTDVDPVRPHGGSRIREDSAIVSRHTSRMREAAAVVQPSSPRLGIHPPRERRDRRSGVGIDPNTGERTNIRRHTDPRTGKRTIVRRTEPTAEARPNLTEQRLDRHAEQDERVLVALVNWRTYGEVRKLTALSHGPLRSALVRLENAKEIDVDRTGGLRREKYRARTPAE